MFATVDARSRRVARARWARVVLVVTLLISQLVVYTQVVDQRPASAGPAIAQTYYTPFEAQEYMDLLRAIAADSGCCTTSVDSTISITSGANGNTVYYDHFEDGYEVDPTSPVQASTVTINLDAGDVWVQNSVVPIDQGAGNDQRGAGNYFDGRDRVVSTAPIAVTQAAFGTDPGTVHAGAVQVLDLDKSGTEFNVPVGENANYNGLWDDVGAVVIATRDETTVDVDADANGSFETQVTLDEGETYVAYGGLSLGADIHADKPVSAYLATGDNGATYEGRFYELYPTSIWSNDMVSPVGSTASGEETTVFLFNPGSGSIDVDVVTGGGATSTLSVGAGSQARFIMPVDEGARFTSQGGEPFYGLQAVTAEGSDTSTYDWGFTLVPGVALTPSVIVPYGPGSGDFDSTAGPDENYSPVWVAAIADTTLYIDLDGDPAVGPLVDPEGNRYDFSCAVSAYDSTTIYADGTTNCYAPSQSSAGGGSRDLTGARIYSLDGTHLSAAWGERAGYVPGSPALDMGTTILPFPEIIMRKSSVLTTDADGDGVADAGDVIEYTVEMENLGIIDVSGVLLFDETPDNTSYVLNSTELDSVPQADDSSPYSPSPLDADSPSGGLTVGSIPPGGVRTATFQMVVDTPIAFGEFEVVNFAVMTTSVGTTSATNRRPLDVPPLQINKTSSPSTSPVPSGGTIDYTVQVFNADESVQTGVDVTDTLPAGTTYQTGTVSADIDGSPIASGAPPNLVTGATLNPGATLTITFQVAVDTPIAAGTTEFTNVAEASSTEYPTPVSDDAVDQAGPLADLSLVKTDDEGVDPLSPGDRLVYTIEVTNAGPDEADDVVVIDTLPGGVTFVPASSDPSCAEGPVGTITCSLGDMGVGATTQFDIAVDIDAGVDGIINNTATVSSSTPEGNPGDETDDEDTAVDSPPTIDVTKSPAPGSLAEPGGTVTFSVSVENTSVESVTLTSLTDDVFGDLLDAGNSGVSSNTCPAQSTTIGVSGTFSCSFQASVAGGYGDPDHVDTVTATADDDEGNTAQDADSATVTFTDVVPTIDVTKSASPGSVPEPGGTVTFSVSVENTSVESVTLTSLTDDVFGDLLDAGNPGVSSNTCPAQSTTIGVSGTFSCSFQASVAGGYGDPDHVDTVTATADDNDGNTATDFDSATVSFTDTLPTISVTKTPSPGSVSEPGGTVTFGVLVQNTSVESVTLTSLTDDVFGDLLDAGNSGVSSNTCPAQSTTIGVSGTFSCSFQASVAGGYGDPDHVDTVTATADDDEGNTAQDADSATVTFTDVVPTIDVTKSASPGSVPEPGGTVTFSVSVENTSVESVTLTSLTDDVFGDLLDAGNPGVSSNTCPAQSTTIGVSGTFSCSFQASVSGFAGDPDHVDTVTATADDNDGNTATDFDSATVVFGDEIPTIDVTKSASPGSVSEPGGTVTFSVSVENTSVESLRLVSLTDSVFGDLLDAGNPGVSSNTCPAQSTTIGVSGTFSCSFQATVAGGYGDPDHLDTVGATAQDSTGNSAQDVDSATVTFSDVLPSVGVTKTPSVSSVLEPGATVQFDLMITNSSVEPVTVVSLADDVFGDLLDSGNPDVSSNSCLALPATMGASGYFACSFDAFVGGGYGDPDHENTVTFTAEDDDGNTAQDTDTATVAFDDVLPVALVSKTPSSGTVEEPGGLVTFSVEISNTVGEDLSLDALTDDVFGDLLDPANPEVSSNACASVSTISAYDSVTCSFSATLNGFYGDPDHVDTVTALVSDDDGNSVSPSDDATVAFTSAGSSVSGFVFEDRDLDGVFDGTDVPLGGIEIEVVDSGGSPTTVTTAADGTWSASVLPGPVTIDVDDATVPSGYSLTTANDTQVLNAVAHTDVPAEDIGYGPPVGSISGVVFLDLDGSLYSDPYEPGFANITVELYDGVGALVTSTASGTDGSYAFGALGPGDYTVVVDGAAIGAGYVASVDPDGVLDDETDEYVLPAEEVENIDFGYRGTASVGDTVWVDEDEDGEFDADEPVLPDAELTLTWAGTDGVLGTSDDYEFGTHVSDANGEYLFEHLPPGLYDVTVDVSDVGLEVEATTATTIEVTLGAGEAFVLADFGFSVDPELPFTGLDAQHLMLAAALMLGLSGLVLADGRKRERRFDLALERVSSSE